MLSGYEQAKKARYESRPYKIKRCRCGRKIMYDRKKEAPKMCGTCLTYGVEKSKESFIKI